MVGLRMLFPHENPRMFRRQYLAYAHLRSQAVSDNVGWHERAIAYILVLADVVESRILSRTNFHLFPCLLGVFYATDESHTRVDCMFDCLISMKFVSLIIELWSTLIVFLWVFES